jgi:adenosyl cobinamide kinase/adenosyl cobinamide phosphate guanylyltransferase
MAAPHPPAPPAGPRLTLVLGGARSGKSALAERLVLGLAGDGPAHYVATAVIDPTDDDIAGRVAAHRARRSGRFRTVEAGDDLAAALRRLPPGPALVDALGTWLASPAVTPAWAGPGGSADLDGPGGLLDALVAALKARAGPTVVVSDEAGLGVHPEHPLGRRWRDALGIVNQRVAAEAENAWLVVAGRVLPLARAESLVMPGAAAPAGSPAAARHPDGGLAPLHDATDRVSPDETDRLP